MSARSAPRRYYEDFLSSGGRIELAEELMTPDVEFYNPISPDGVKGLEAYKVFVRRWYEGFPDRLFTVNDEVIEGDKIAIRFTITGTHRGEFMGVPGTGNKIEVHGMNLFLLENGKIKHVQAFFNPLDLLEPLGVKPPKVKR